MAAGFAPSDADVSRRMSKQRTKDTAIEVAVRQILYRAGLRYRVHYPIPGIPRRSIDIAFTAHRVAIFIDGCFWHGCTLHRNIPSSNRAAWELKISANQERDRHSEQHLIDQGWMVLRFWEHTGATEIAATVSAAIRERTRSYRR
jgi:DNA mismatch endonuclease (patch repair protein)